MAKSLNDLPAEVRLTIYEHLFADCNLIYSPPQQYRTRSGKTPVLRCNVYGRGWTRPRTDVRGPAAILCVSRQTHLESRAVLLRTAAVNITNLVKSDWTIKLLPDCFALALQVRHLRLNWYQFDLLAGAAGMVKRSFDYMPNIKSLVLSPGSFDSVYLPDFTGATSLDNRDLRPEIVRDISRIARRRLTAVYRTKVWNYLHKTWLDQDCQYEFKMYWSTLDIRLPACPTVVVKHYKADADFAAQTFLVMDKGDPGRIWNLPLPLPAST